MDMCWVCSCDALWAAFGSWVLTAADAHAVLAATPYVQPHCGYIEQSIRKVICSCSNATHPCNGVGLLMRAAFKFLAMIGFILPGPLLNDAAAAGGLAEDLEHVTCSTNNQAAKLDIASIRHLWRLVSVQCCVVAVEHTANGSTALR